MNAVSKPVLDRMRENRVRDDGARETETAVAYVRECQQAGVERRALLVRLADLPCEFARPHHLRLARQSLHLLVAADRARLFVLRNDDLLVIWRGEAAMALAAATSEISHLFAGSDLDTARLIQPMSLPLHAGLLLDHLAAAARRTDAAPEPPKTPPVDAVCLGALEDSLAQADVSRFARRKRVHRHATVRGFRPAWEKRHLSTSEIMQTLMPDRALRSDPWLYRRLTRLLDRRLLALLAAPDELRGAGPFSLNLNVGSVLSPDFLRFDEALPGELRGAVVLELQPADVVADLAAFLFARDFAHARGYRVLLRGVTAGLVQMFSPDRLGVDLMQIRWEAAFARISLRDERIDPARVVLTRVPSGQRAGEDALVWARSEGIQYFQGLGAAVTSNR